MTLESYLSGKDRSYARKTTNINDLLSRAKLERKKERKVTYLVIAAASSFLIIFSLAILF